MVCKETSHYKDTSFMIKQSCTIHLTLLIEDLERESLFCSSLKARALSATLHNSNPKLRFLSLSKRLNMPSIPDSLVSFSLCKSK